MSQKYADVKLIKNTHIKIFTLLALIAFLILVSTPSIQKNKTTRLLTQEQNRSINLGELLPASEAYKMSPFAIDFSFGEKVEKRHLLFSSLRDDGIHPTHNHKEYHRLFLSQPGEIGVTYNFYQPIVRSPRLSLYNDELKLIDKGEVSRTEKDGNNIYIVRFQLEAGLYRLKQRFNSENVKSIELKYKSQGGNQKTNHSEYLNKNIKSIYLRVFPGQLVKLNEMRDARANNWDRFRRNNWLNRNLPSPDEVLQASVRSENGGWGVAEIGLSGRNKQHRSTGSLPSLDVEIRAGELPYGLRRFKLYTLPSKSNGLDMFMEQLIGDLGLPIYREDIVKVYLNDRYAGLMQLWEAIDSSFFEYAQVAEGPVVGYDTDSLIANPGHSWFVPKSYHKPKEFRIENQTDIGSLGLNEKTCSDTQSKALSLGLFYAGMHGLGSDTKYYFNPRLNCFSPLYKDFNAGILHINPSDSNYKFLSNALRALSILTPNWRPYTPTYSSYFVYRNKLKPDFQQGFYWWTVIPSVMNHMLSSKNDHAFEYNMKRLYSNWHQSRVDSRLSNFEMATRNINSTTEDSERFITSFTYPKLAEVIPWKHWESLFSKTESCAGTALGELMNLSSNGVIEPDCREIEQLSWRNTLLETLLSQGNKLDKQNEPKAELFKIKATNGIASFLYQKNTKDVLHVFFSQRGCKNNACTGKLYLVDDQTDSIIKPTKTYLRNGLEHSVDLVDVFTNDIQDNENIKLYYFAIPKKLSYQFLIPQFDGPGYYLGSHGLAVPPLEKSVLVNESKENLSKHFDINAKQLRLKRPSSVIEGQVVIPDGFIWMVEQDTTIQLKESGCFLIKGDLRVAPKKQLHLEAFDDSGWSGLHFQGNADLNIRNLYLDNVGQNNENINCGGQTYTGAVSVYDTKIDISNMHISNNRSEDALHLLNSHASIKNSTITNTISDAVDSDYSVVDFQRVTIESAGVLSDLGGDGIDLSGSLAKITDSKIIDSSDKNISLGENSYSQLNASSLIGSEIGIAIKDASKLEMHQSTIQDTPIGVAIYSKKPYYAFPKFAFEKNSVIFKNVTDELKNAKYSELY